MEKLDFVIMPKFLAGGMENWGLIVCDARYFLSSTTKFSEKLYLLSTLSPKSNL